jgi:hypothetical protein
VPLPLLLYPRGRGYKECNRVSYNMIPTGTLSLLAYFIDIVIYALGSTPWSSWIFWMVGWILTDLSLDLPSPCEVVPRVLILVIFSLQTLSPCYGDRRFSHSQIFLTSAGSHKGSWGASLGSSSSVGTFSFIPSMISWRFKCRRWKFIFQPDLSMCFILAQFLWSIFMYWCSVIVLQIW